MIVEDGTKKTNADSYVDVSYANDYFTSHGVSKWATLTNTQKEVALVKATDYIDNVFDWNGKKASAEQSLNFPREDLYTKDGYEVDGIPKVLKDAVCEATSLIINDTELYQSVSENGLVTSEHIGNLSFTYDVSQKIKDSALYESINYRLRGLFKDSTKKKIYQADIRRKL